jgi:pyruvate dehydrogenase (quinone)/pyruvate oxidase
MEDCDTLLIVGSSFPYIEFYPKPGQAKCVQIELDPNRVSLRYPADAALIGDAAVNLRALLKTTAVHSDRSFLETSQYRMAKWRKLMSDRATRSAAPMKPQWVANQLNELLADDAIIATDSGTITTWAARYLDIRGSMMFSCSGGLATMACGLPYANAAALAYPGRQVIAFVGDGGLSMLLSELATTVKYQLEVKVVVIKNNTLGQIKWEQMVFLGNPEYVCDLQPIDFATVARGFGIKAVTIEDENECSNALRVALSTPGPVLIEAVVDPHEPPHPPKVTLDQAAKFAESLVRGTPNAGKIALTVASDVVREIV